MASLPQESAKDNLRKIGLGTQSPIRYEGIEAVGSVNEKLCSRSAGLILSVGGGEVKNRRPVYTRVTSRLREC